MSQFIGNPAFIVHTHSGDMVNALRGKMDRTRKAYRIDFNLSRAPHAKFVVEGTKVMLPRDVLWSTTQGKGTQKAIMKTIVDVLGRQFRTQSVVRFAKNADGSRRLVILAMRKKGHEAELAHNEACLQAGRTLQSIIKRNISSTKNTLEDLRRKGHPYARRHGSIQVNKI